MEKKNYNRYYILLANGTYVNSIKGDDVYYSREEFSVDHATMQKYTQRLNQMKIGYEVIKL